MPLCIWHRIEEYPERFIQHIKNRTQNVLMTIFLVEERRIMIFGIMELVEIIRTVSAYGNEQKRFTFFLVRNGC